MGIESRIITTITCNSCGKNESVYNAKTILDMMELFPKWYFIGLRKFCECPDCSKKRFNKESKE
jgi:hypothetical protein